MHAYPNYYLKTFYFFSLLYIKMNGKNINFNNKNIKNVTFTIKTKKYLIYMILMLIKYQSLKKNNMANIIHLNTFIRPLYLFLSQTIGYINKFDKNKITMSLMIKDIQLLKSYNKIWKKN